MSDTATTPRQRRHAQTTGEILDAAWRLARRDGLAAISMRDLGREVGLRAQSLYAYFDSKADLFDAMFRQGHQARQQMSAGWDDIIDGDDDPRRVMKRLVRDFAEFCNDDPVRYQLLFQRTIPDWEPSAASYALALEQVESLERNLGRVGITGDRAIDMWTAIITGLTSQQLSNDPGGDRWIRLLDDAVDLFFDFYGPD